MRGMSGLITCLPNYYMFKETQHASLLTCLISHEHRTLMKAFTSFKLDSSVTKTEPFYA